MALLLGMAMLPAGAIAMQVGLNAVSARQAALEESYISRAVQSLEVERDVVDETRELLRVLATAPALQTMQPAACRTWLNAVVSEYNYIAAIAVLHNDGRLVCSIPQAPPSFHAPSSNLRATAQQRDSFTLGFVPNSTLINRPVLGALEPLRGAGGARVGFVGASIAIEDIRGLLERSRAIDGARVALVGADGAIITQSGAMPGAAAMPTAAQIRARIGARPGIIHVPDGAAVVVPLQPPDLYAVMTWSATDTRVQRWLEIGLSVAAPLIIWLLAVAAGWFAIEVYVARPLYALEDAARGFARGEDVNEPPDLAAAPMEIRSLRRTLAAMAKTLRGREARLVDALGEERALLREIHHRVKNNLQMVASLLNIQARSARDESEAWGLARAHDRVQLLALVHQRIYASGEVREVRLDDICAEMARQLLQARGAQTKDVTLSLHLSEGRASADQAVPMAFLLGETFSAALDSVADSGKAELAVYLTQSEDGEVRFAIVADRGGQNAALAMGGRLIEAFARQLGARLGRQASPFMLWAVVPPSAQDS